MRPTMTSRARYWALTFISRCIVKAFKIIAGATLGWLSITYDEYDGNFSYVHARTTYNFTDHFGVSLGYQYVDLDFTRDRDRGETGIEASFDGPSVVLTYGF